MVADVRLPVADGQENMIDGSNAPSSERKTLATATVVVLGRPRFASSARRLEVER